MSIPENITYEPKKAAYGDRIIIVPGGILKQGTYDGYKGPFSTAILGDSKKLIAVLINGNYYLANEIVIANDCIQIPKIEKISEKAGIVTASAILNKGDYLSFNGPDAAFLFDKKTDQIKAVLVGRDECELYIETKAAEYNGEIGDDGLPKSLLNVTPYFVYKAMISENCTVILDKEGKPVYILGENQK
jgi:hypothetical protein